MTLRACSRSTTVCGRSPPTSKHTNPAESSSSMGVYRRTLGIAASPASAARSTRGCARRCDRARAAGAGRTPRAAPSDARTSGSRPACAASPSVCPSPKVGIVSRTADQAWRRDPRPAPSRAARTAICGSPRRRNRTPGRPRRRPRRRSRARRRRTAGRARTRVALALARRPRRRCARIGSFRPGARMHPGDRQRRASAASAPVATAATISSSVEPLEVLVQRRSARMARRCAAAASRSDSCVA